MKQGVEWGAPENVLSRLCAAFIPVLCFATSAGQWGLHIAPLHTPGIKTYLFWLNCNQITFDHMEIQVWIHAELGQILVRSTKGGRVLWPCTAVLSETQVSNVLVVFLNNDISCHRASLFISTLLMESINDWNLRWFWSILISCVTVLTVTVLESTRHASVNKQPPETPVDG